MILNQPYFVLLFNDLLLLMIFICSLLKVLHAEQIYNPSYKIHHHQNGPYVVDANVDVKTLDSATMDNIPANMLDIKWVNSTTDSVTINWTLNEEYNITGFIRDSVVEYITQVGRFRSHPLNSNVRYYTFEHLQAGAVYTFCVYMSEVHGLRNFSTYLHSKCVKINTLDYIRRDSLIVVMITLGYYFFMGLLGFTQWKRRQWRVAKRIDKSYTNESPTENNIAVMRWKDLAERERLLNKPGCSIESNDT